eukprot:TRINITY_DN1905_c0_g1_i1.p1 TRINITY_DN1905_c0_g1~~TRINITY_DN1905_c0_g1_i1.p1  ORF type:complete len:576 (+),score=180.82 TRINITY_DN1905_c0_g1_i1:71-1729(+)
MEEAYALVTREMARGGDEVGGSAVLTGGALLVGATAALGIQAARQRARRRAAPPHSHSPAFNFPMAGLAQLATATAGFLAAVVLLWMWGEHRYPAPPSPPEPEVKVHKSIWPLDGTDIAGFLCAIIGLLLASGGGIGGGGILVPTYILVFGFVDKHAIPLSNITIFGGSIANCWLNWPHRHPWLTHPPPGKHRVDRPLIDFDLVLAMEPLTIAGAILGSLLNKVLPSLVVTVMLVLVLGFTAWKTLTKAAQLWQEEARHKFHKGDPVAELAEAVDGGEGFAEDEAEARPLLDAEQSSPVPARSIAAVIETEKEVPWDKIFALAVLFVGCLVMSLLKGGPPDILANPLWSTCGGKLYWFMLAMQIPWCVGFALLVRGMLLRQNRAREQAGYDCPARAQFVWNNTTTIRYPLICSLAGLFAGLFGIGGGIVKGPLMIAMGVQAEVSGATAAFMIFFTTSSASLSYALFGLLRFDYAAAMFAVGFLTTCVGQLLVKRIVKSTGHPSVVAWVIGATVGVSALLMGYHGALSLLHAKDPWAAPPLCTTPPLYTTTPP